MVFEPLTPDRRRQQTRVFLLKAAAEVFAKRGYHGASLDEVARAAGFTKGAVYSNFKNKEDLFLALLEALYDEEFQQLDAMLAESEVPANERLSDFVQLISGAPGEGGEPPLGVVPPLLYLEFFLYAVRHPETGRRLSEIQHRAVNHVAEIIAAEQAAGRSAVRDSPEVLSELVDALFRGIVMLRMLDPDVVDEAFLQSALSFTVRGLLGSVDTEQPGDLGTSEAPSQ